MPYNPNPYYSPYGSPNYGGFNQFQQPQQPQTNTYAFVNGIEGAKSYPIGPNQTVMLMDSDNPIAYMKSSDGMGRSSIKYFRLMETSESELRGVSKPVSDYVLKSDFEALSKKVEELIQKEK